MKMGCNESSPLQAPAEEKAKFVITAEKNNNNNEAIAEKHRRTTSHNRVSPISSQSLSDDLSPRNKRRKSAEKKNVEVEIVNSVLLDKYHSQYVDLCEWSPKQDLFVTASTDRKAFLWNCRIFQDAKSVDVMPIELPGQDSVSCLSWSENGKMIILGSNNGKVSTWSSTGKFIHSWQAHATSSVKCVQMNSNHDFVLSGADEICVYNLLEKTAQLTCWNQASITAIQWIDNAIYIAAEASGLITMDQIHLDWFKKLEKYDEEDFIPETRPLKRLSAHNGGVYKLAPHPVNREVVASGSVDCLIKIWDLSSKKPHKAKNLEGHFGYVVDLAWLSTTSRLASASFDGSVKIWDTIKGLCLFSLQEGMGYVNCLSSSKSGLYLASAGHDGHVYFWNTKSGLLVNRIEGPGRIMATGFNYFDSKFALGSYGSVMILELSFYNDP